MAEQRSLNNRQLALINDLDKAWAAQVAQADFEIDAVPYQSQLPRAARLFDYTSTTLRPNNLEISTSYSNGVLTLNCGNLGTKEVAVTKNQVVTMWQRATRLFGNVPGLVEKNWALGRSQFTVGDKKPNGAGQFPVFSVDCLAHWLMLPNEQFEVLAQYMESICGTNSSTFNWLVACYLPPYMGITEESFRDVCNALAPKKGPEYAQRTATEFTQYIGNILLEETNPSKSKMNQMILSGDKFKKDQMFAGTFVLCLGEKRVQDGNRFIKVREWGMAVPANLVYLSCDKRSLTRPKNIGSIMNEFIEVLPVNMTPSKVAVPAGNVGDSEVRANSFLSFDRIAIGKKTLLQGKLVSPTGPMVFTYTDKQVSRETNEGGQEVGRVKYLSGEYKLEVKARPQKDGTTVGQLAVYTGDIKLPLEYKSPVMLSTLTGEEAGAWFTSALQRVKGRDSLVEASPLKIDLTGAGSSVYKAGLKFRLSKNGELVGKSAFTPEITQKKTNKLGVVVGKESKKLDAPFELDLVLNNGGNVGNTWSQSSWRVDISHKGKLIARRNVTGASEIEKFVSLSVSKALTGQLSDSIIFSTILDMHLPRATSKGGFIRGNFKYGAKKMVINYPGANISVTSKETGEKVEIAKGTYHIEIPSSSMAVEANKLSDFVRVAVYKGDQVIANKMLNGSTSEISDWVSKVIDKDIFG